MSVATETWGHFMATGLPSGPGTGKSKITVCVYCNCKNWGPFSGWTVSIQKIDDMLFAFALVTTNGILMMEPDLSDGVPIGVSLIPPTGLALTINTTVLTNF